MKKILITGGTGLLGKEIVKGFIEVDAQGFITDVDPGRS